MFMYAATMNREVCIEQANSCSRAAWLRVGGNMIHLGVGTKRSGYRGFDGCSGGSRGLLSFRIFDGLSQLSRQAILPKP